MVNIESVDLNLFLVLDHVLSEGSVARAAERLHVTSSAVSNALARLRSLLEDPLLVRNGRKLAPTPRARELAPEVAKAIEGLRAILEPKASFQPKRCTREFTIATADHIGVVPGIVERFSRALPRATLRIVTLDHAVASDGLSSGEIDLLLGLPPMLPRDRRSEPAYTDRLVCAVRRDGPLARGKLTLDRFLAASHVEVALQGKYAIDYVDGVLSRLGRARSIAVSVPQFTMAASCVVGTPYVAMLPERMARQLASFLPLALREPPLDLPPITILQVWHTRTDDDPASRLLRTIVRDTGKEDRTRARTPASATPDE